MEADILAEGFSMSLQTHGLKYSYFVGDGDSSVYPKLLEIMPYAPEEVKKIECRNHILRNYHKHLREDIYKAKGAARLGCVEQRKLVQFRAQRLINAINGAIRHHKNLNDVSEKEKIKGLQKDILNSARHVFGDHAMCATTGNYFCKKQDEQNHVPDLEKTGVFQAIMKILNRVKDQADSLIHDVSSNKVENFFSQVAKLNGGKRINFSLKDGFKSRCNGAVIAHNTGCLHSLIHEKLPRKSPNKLMMKIEANLARKKANAKRRLFIGNAQKLKWRQSRTVGYESNAFATVSDEAKMNFIQTLSLDENQIQILEGSTLQQSNCSSWHNERRKRLTASNFGTVCKLRKTTSKQLVAYRIMNGLSGSLPALAWGRERETSAIEGLQNKMGISVKRCGFFVDKDFPYLGASPDGLVDHDHVVEIKCPSSARYFKTIKDAVIAKKCNHLKVVDDQIILNRRHSYFFQVQGQMKITGRSKCYFVTWIPEDIHIIVVDFEPMFWLKRMEVQLKSFYLNNRLPCTVNDF